MKTLIALLIVLFASPVFAGTWCEWSGTEGENCQSDTKGYIKTADGLPVGISADGLNPRGWYERTTTKPTVGADQTRDTEVWSFTDSQIGLTWTVRDLTTEEIDQREASAMEIGQYYLWKALIAKGVITQAEAVDVLPAELIDAYQARQRLLQ